MAKLTSEDKIKIIELYKQGYGANLIAKKMNIQFSRAREFIRQYDLFGDLILEVSHKNRKYSTEYKIELINRVNSGESITSVQLKI